MKRLVKLVLMLAALLVAGGCGVALDDTARELALDDIPQSLRPGQLPESEELPVADGATQPIYMVGPDARLFVVFRNVPPTPDAVIESLLLDVTQAERQAGIDSAMTRTTEVLSIDVNPLFQLATVTLTPNSLGATSEDQLLGFGQIVFTLTELDGIEAVDFQTIRGNDGETTEALRVQTDGGPTDPGVQVRRADFASIDTVGRNIVPTFPDEDAIATPPPIAPPVDLGRVIDVPIWLLNPDNQLVQVTRRVERTPQAVIQTLLDGPLVVEEEEGFRTAINEDALAKKVEPFVVVDDERGPLGTAVVDLSAESLPPFEANDERQYAVAQIVYTLTGLVEIDQVLFTIDGVPTPMPTQFGLSEEFTLDNPAGGLTRSDYSEYALAIRIVERPTAVPGEPAPADEPDQEPDQESAPDGEVVPEPTPEPSPTPTS